MAAEDTVEANEYTLQVALIPFTCIFYPSSFFRYKANADYNYGIISLEINDNPQRYDMAGYDLQHNFCY